MVPPSPSTDGTDGAIRKSAPTTVHRRSDPSPQPRPTAHATLPPRRMGGVHGACSLPSQPLPRARGWRRSPSPSAPCTPPRRCGRRAATAGPPVRPLIPGPLLGRVIPTVSGPPAASPSHSLPPSIPMSPSGDRRAGEGASQQPAALVAAGGWTPPGGEGGRHGRPRWESPVCSPERAHTPRSVAPPHRAQATMTATRREASPPPRSTGHAPPPPSTLGRSVAHNPSHSHLRLRKAFRYFLMFPPFPYNVRIRAVECCFQQHSVSPQVCARGWALLFGPPPLGIGKDREAQRSAAPEAHLRPPGNLTLCPSFPGESGINRARPSPHKFPQYPSMMAVVCPPP